MLRFILGTDGEARREIVYADIKKRLQDNKMSWVLVPEQFSLFAEKELIQRFGLPAQKNIKVLTFSGLCNMVFQKSGPLRMRYIDGAGKHIIVVQVMELVKDKLTILKGNIKQRGFAKVVADLISEFKRYGVLPQSLRFAAENTKIEEFSGKLNDLAIIYQEYNKLIDEKNSDAEDNLALCCDRLSDCDYLYGRMYMLHFRSFTPVEHRAIEALMKVLDLWVSLDYSQKPEYGGLFSPIYGTIKKMRESAQRLGVAEDESLVFEIENDDSAIKKVREKYFDPRADVLTEKCEDISIYQVKNNYREVEAVADLIIRLCRTEGYRMGDFLVLARETDKYNRLMPGIFQKRGIHIFLDTRRSIASKPLVRMICGVLDIIARGYSYERAMEILRSGLFDLKDDDIDQFENYILAAAPTHVMWQEDKWEYQPAKINWNMEVINNIHKQLKDRVNGISDKITGRKTGGDIATAILEWLKDTQLDKIVSSKMERLNNQNMPELSGEYGRVWNAIISVLSQISAVMSETPMTYQAFAELFKESVSGIEIGITPQLIDSVVFSSIDRFRAEGAKVVIVLGMNEGVFPKGYMSEGLISDAERRKLYDLGIELASDMESKRREEQLLIYAVLSAAEEKLIFFTPLQDNSGRVLSPSGVIKRINEIMPQIPVINPDRDGLILGGAEGEEAAFDFLASSMALYGENLSSEIRELYNYFEKSDQYKERLIELKSVIDRKNPEKITLEMVEKIYGKPISLSASQLESYNSCAFKYFLNYGLALREREIAGVESRNMGTVQHDALYDYFTELKDKGVDFEEITQEECFNKISEYVEEEAKKNSELLYESSAYFRYIVMRMKGIASRTAWEVVKFYKSSSFRPYGFEIKIGQDGEIPAVNILDDNGEKIAGIKGFIDRADMAKVGERTLINVIDYKSSAKDLDIKLTEDGITIQPLLYADAICKSVTGAEPAALVYMQMNDPIIDESKAKKGVDIAVNKEMTPKGWIVDDKTIMSAYTAKANQETGDFVPGGTTSKIGVDELKKRMEKMNQKIRESAMNIAGGVIAPKPYRTGKYDACQYCPYFSVCNIK